MGKKVNKAWLWDVYRHKWQQQYLGTDLVFRDGEVLVWTVQAKCYAEARSATKGDLIKTSAQLRLRLHL